MTPFVMAPKKYPQNLYTPKNIHFSEKKNPQNIEIQNIEQKKKNSPHLRMYKNYRVPPSPARCVVPAQAMNSFSKLKGQDVNLTIFAVFSA